MHTASTLTFSPGKEVRQRLEEFNKTSGIPTSKTIRECLLYALDKLDNTKPGIVFKG